MMHRALVDSSLSSESDPGDIFLCWAVRLICLMPGATDDSIRCELQASTIGQCQGSYEALSYVWGNPIDKVPIQIDGQPFLVTQNLEAALRMLRRRSKPRILWVDALCINQADVHEVNTQVQRMWAIFQNAWRVLVSLGERNQSSDEAFAMVSLLATLRVGRSKGRITALLEDPEQSARWQSLLELLHRPWWRRAWVIQEYAVAKSVIFVCGTAEMLGKEFSQALDVLVDYRFNGSVPPQHHRLIRHVASTPINHMLSVRRSYQWSEPDSRPSAMTVLYRFRGHESSDPRDKIYSVYKLINEHPMLAPDYTKTAVDLFQDVVRVMIEASGTLEVLSHHNRGVDGISGLPSWCPDWTVLRGKRLLLWPNNYCAAGGSELPAECRIRDKLLGLKGRLLDRVTWCIGFESEEFEDQATIYRRLLEVQLYARQCFKSDIGDDSDDVFQRTLVAARVYPKGPNHESMTLERGDGNTFWSAWTSRIKGEECDEVMAERYNNGLYSAMSSRAFVMTQSGRMGLVDGTVCVGDVIGVFSGSCVPLALRERQQRVSGTAKRYELVGECYLHGVMSGEAFPNTPSAMSEIWLI